MQRGELLREGRGLCRVDRVHVRDQALNVLPKRGMIRAILGSESGLGGIVQDRAQLTAYRARHADFIVDDHPGHRLTIRGALQACFFGIEREPFRRNDPLCGC